MRDVNNAVLEAYYSVISALPLPVYEGEEPDNVTDPIYVVLNDVVGTETSTKSSSDLEVTIQISVHSWAMKYNNSKSLNQAVDDILQAIKPDSNSVLDLSGFGLQMLNLILQTDRTERFGELAGKVYITRNLIFKQDIFIL